MAQKPPHGADVRSPLNGRRLGKSNAPQGDERDVPGNTPTPHFQGSGHGHKAQFAQPHRSGRPSGGNIRREPDE